MVRRVIGRIYCANWGDIVLDSKRNGTGSLYIGSGKGHGCEDPGQWDLCRKDCELKWTLGSDCRRACVKEVSRLVGCEELSILLQ